jgi:hypothetical protein
MDRNQRMITVGRRKFQLEGSEGVSFVQKVYVDDIRANLRGG